VAWRVWAVEERSVAVFEQALTRALGEQSDEVPAELVTWLVTGHWPAPALQCDVSYPSPDWSRLAGF
jgi:hypothetical protein